jgi:hypothetical protein
MHIKLITSKEWNPVTNLLRICLISTKALLILLSLCIVLWEGYQVTVTYTSQPISTEQKLLPLNSVSNIVMSICKVIEITDCAIGVGNKILQNCTAQQLPAFINHSNYENYWNYTENGTHTFQLRDILDSIHAWNAPDNSWKTVYDSSIMSIEEEKAIFHRQMYPYSGNHTLLCYTFQKDIIHLVPFLKFHRKGKYSFTAQLC